MLHDQPSRYQNVPSEPSRPPERDSSSALPTKYSRGFVCQHAHTNEGACEGGYSPQQKASIPTVAPQDDSGENRQLVLPTLNPADFRPDGGYRLFADEPRNRQEKTAKEVGFDEIRDSLDL